VKNIIQWKKGSSLNFDRISMMQREMDDLKENERELDIMISSLKDISKKELSSRLAYVTCQDLHSIDMYTDQMLMVAKMPAESQLELMDIDENGLQPLHMRSEKEEIEIFFCPDSNSSEALQTTICSQESTESEDESASVPKHRKSLSASAHKRRGLGSAQRNLSKAFEEMAPRDRRSRTKLLNEFNGAIQHDSSSDNDAVSAKQPSTSSFNIPKDVSLPLFSPQKTIQYSGTGTLSEIPHNGLSPNSFSFTNIDDPISGFYSIEPEAEYDFLLADSEGILDLFDCNL
jgi:hypothetical protein